MDVKDVKKVVGNLLHMTVSQAETLTAHIQKYNCENILELGFNHGVSTCYIAAALQNMGKGTVITIDKESAKYHQPNIEDLLRQTGGLDRVTIYYESTSYTWRMMKFLEQDPTPQFDLCYLDGAHNWFVDGFAFFLVDRLLKPGGWIIFDDLDWTYAKSPALSKTEFVKNMPIDEKITPQVQKIYELLVKKHPMYGEFKTENNWAYARKIKKSEFNCHVKTEIVMESIVSFVKRKFRDVIRGLS